MQDLNNKMVVPVSVKDIPFMRAFALQQRLLSSPWFGIVQASCPKGHLLRRHVFVSQTPVCSYACSIFITCVCNAQRRCQKAAAHARDEAVDAVPVVVTSGPKSVQRICEKSKLTWLRFEHNEKATVSKTRDMVMYLVAGSRCASPQAKCNGYSMCYKHLWLHAKVQEAWLSCARDDLYLCSSRHPPADTNVLVRKRGGAKSCRDYDNMCMYIYIYIYIQREREREKERYTCIHI